MAMRNREDDGMITKVVSINRVSKTVKGGRIMKFAALVVVGDGKGTIGYGIGKSGEVPEAIAPRKQSFRNNGSRRIPASVSRIGGIVMNFRGIAGRRAFRRAHSSVVRHAARVHRGPGVSRVPGRYSICRTTLMSLRHSSYLPRTAGT